MKTIIQWWSKYSLMKRLMLVMGIFMVFGVVVVQVLFLRQERVRAQNAINEQTMELRKLLPANLLESILAGDYVALQEKLRLNVDTKMINQIYFVDTKGVLIDAKNASFQPSIAPLWVVNMMGLPSMLIHERIIVEGVEYGVVHVRLSASYFIDEMWNQFIIRSFFAFGMIFVVLMGMWFLLRQELGALSQLEHTLMRYDGSGDVALPPVEKMTPEVRNLFIVFDAMVREIAQTQNALVEESIKSRKEKAWLETVLDTLFEGVYVIDEAGLILEVNAQACKILGYEKEELLGVEAHGLLHVHNASYATPTLCLMYQAFSEGHSYKGDDAYFKDKNGRIMPVELFATILMQEGRKRGMVVVFRDITQQKADNAHMKLLSSALNASTNAVVITTKEAIIEWANPAFETLTGYSVGEALGHNPHELIGSGLQEKFFYEQMWNTILSFKPWNGEVINKRKDGTLYPEALHITPVVDRWGEIAHFIAIKEDISMLKSSFEALKAAKMEAETAKDAKTQFLANMSHEIRTPLNAIIGFNDIMMNTPLNHKQKLILSKIKSASEILLRILNDILDFSKIEAEKLELEIKEVCLSELLMRINEMFIQTASQKNLALHVSLDELAPACINADGLRLTQILMNLTSNAVKFTHEGSVRVNVAMMKQEEEDVYLRFSVDDTGIGISEDKLTTIFLPFTQADISTTRKYGGTGLGLSIALKLVEAMGSTIEVQSREGEGSSFFFVLRVPISKSTTSPQKQKRSLGLPDLSGWHILVVEDNVINQEVMKEIIEKTGAHVVLANNGKEGVEIFVANRDSFICILMDILMPVMNGYEATAKIREVDATIPIIALSAEALDEDKAKALQSGMNEYLLKPIHPQALYTLLSNISRSLVPLPQGMPVNISETASLPIILIVDDDVSNIHLLTDILKADYHIKVCTDGASALKLSKELQGIDLILLDVVMPLMDGYAVCRALKENSITQKIPVVFISAKNSAEDEAYGFSLGGADYITKPLNPSIVRARVRHQIELKTQNDILEKLSMNDALTKIRNRGYFDDYYDAAYKQLARDGGVLCVMMLDIDYFKLYNDHYGHGEGDICLVRVASALKTALQRPTDMVARYGGEEFVVVLKNISYEGALKVAEALRLSVETLGIPHGYSTVAPFVTISVGVAFKKLDVTLSSKELLKRADDALYEAKVNGRNRVVSYEISA